MADATGLHIHTLAVRDHRITCDSPVLVQHGMGHDAIALDLDAEWDGLSVRLVLGPCESAYDVLYEDAPVVVPAATLAEARWLPVSVVGYGGDGTARVTTERCDHLLRVVESGCVDGSEPIPDAPDLLGQLVEAAGKATDAAGKANEAAGTATEAAMAAQDAVAKVDEAVSDLGDAAANAAAARESAEAAAKSASDARASEDSARASAESASADASSASSSEAAARQSATEASFSATGASQSATEAKASAESASESASFASADARTASQSASTAESAASFAGDAAADAQSSAGTAQDAATSAQEDASTAQTAAETATTQAQAASASASAAAQSATDAKASADLAAGWVPADGEPGQLLSKTEDGTAWVDPPSTGNVLTGEAEGYVAHAEDAYAAKPREVRIEGRTVKNLWPVMQTSTSNGATLTVNDDGSFTMSGTATAAAEFRFPVQGIAPGTQYTLKASNRLEGLNFMLASQAEDGAWLANSVIVTGYNVSMTATGTTAENAASFACKVIVTAGVELSDTYRLMLVEGDTAPDCFTPPASITSVEPTKLVTAGRNLLNEDAPTVDGVVGPQLPPGDYALSGTLPSGASLKLLNGSADGEAITDASSLPHTFHSGRPFTPYYAGVGGYATGLMLELGSTATAYEPPNVTGVALPETEPLMYIYDRGDELVIAQDGTVTVKRQTYHELFDGSNSYYNPVDMDGYQYVALNSTKTKPTGVNIPMAAVISDRFVTGMPGKKAPGIVALTTGSVSPNGGNYIAFLFCFEPGTFADAGQVRQWFTDNPTNVWFAGMPEIEQLGTVQLPQLPAPTFNAYHDSQVPSDTSVEYERDINIVIDNLTKQVAGTASAVAVREASTIEEE